MDDNPYQTPQEVCEEDVASEPPPVDDRWELREELARDLAIISLLSALATAVVPAALAGISSGTWLDTALRPMVWLLLATGVTTGAIGLQGGIRHARLTTIAVACGGLLLNAWVAYFAWLISLGV